MNRNFVNARRSKEEDDDDDDDSKIDRGEGNVIIFNANYCIINC